MLSWRLKQLQMQKPGFIIAQDAVLIEFIKQHRITSLGLLGDLDADYFQSHLPKTRVNNNPDSEMLAVFETVLEITFENFLNRLSNLTDEYRPKWLYVAINKYVVTTNTQWHNLTDNYDNDLLDIITSILPKYTEVSRKYISDDTGQYFNFAHPTTNIYYQRR